MVLAVRFEHLQAQNTKSDDVTLTRLVQAVKAIDQQQFQEAEHLLNSVLATAPNDGDANNLLGAAQVRVLAMRDVHAHNTFENPGVVQPRNETAGLTGGTISYRFPPASVTRLEITVA